MQDNFRLHIGDCLEVLKTLPDASIDAIVTDPPYGLSFMGKKWDYDVPAVEVWAECLRVLKPGGHLLAFAGTRTQHRMAVRIEDAGFEIRDLIAWVYGSGFPKSHDVSKAIDKAAGAEREVVGSAKNGCGNTDRSIHKADGFAASRTTEYDLTAPATDAARQWSGWGTALKPALEPITVARKPLDGTVAQNVLTHGTGAINVDGCRISSGERPSVVSDRRLENNTFGQGLGGSRSDGTTTLGRWPANLIHDGSDEVVGLFPQAGGGDARGNPGGRRSGGFGDVGADKGDGRPNSAVYSDSGSAARFFYCAKASKRDRDEGLDHLEARRPAAAEFRPNHAEKAEAGEDGNPYGRWGEVRNIHPTVKPTDLMRYLCRLVTPPGGVVLDPFMGSGSTGKAAMREGFRFVGIERDPQYMEIAEARVRSGMAPAPAEDPAPDADNDNTPADLFALGINAGP